MDPTSMCLLYVNMNIYISHIYHHHIHCEIHIDETHCFFLGSSYHFGIFQDLHRQLHGLQSSAAEAFFHAYQVLQLCLLPRWAPGKPLKKMGEIYNSAKKRGEISPQ